MTLKDELDGVVKSAISDLGEIRGELTELEHAMPGVCARTQNIRHIMMTLATRLTGIKVIMAKEVMCGNEEQATKQERTEHLELFANAARFDCGDNFDNALLLASLHRAGDHSLDVEEEAP